MKTFFFTVIGVSVLLEFLFFVSLGVIFFSI